MNTSTSNNLEELTIIIPTYGRPTYVLRNMKFWSDKGPRIIVLDGSEEPLSKQNLRGLGTNIEYFHHFVSFNKRMEIASSMVNTPFAMLCADDEIQVPSGLKQCIEFLKKNDDYEQCCGRSIRFTVSGRILKLEAAKVSHRFHVINQDNPIDRARYHLSDFMTTTVYAVHRSASLKHCLHYSMANNFGNPYPLETLFEIAAAAYGKSKVLSCVTWLRSSENEPVAAPGWLRKDVLSDWHDNPKNNSQVGLFYETAKSVFEHLITSSDKKDIGSEVIDILRVRISHDRNMAKIKRLTAPGWPTPPQLSFLLSALRKFKIFCCKVLPEIAPIFLPNCYLSSGKFYSRTFNKFYGIQIQDKEELSSIWKGIIKFHKESALLNKNPIIENNKSGSL